MSDKKNTKAPTASTGRAQSRRDEMRALANQAAANAPGIEERLSQARGLIGSHPLRSEQAPTASRAESTSEVTMLAPDSNRTANGQVGVPYHVATPRGMYELVPLANIVENPFNARKTYREARITEMKASIAANGQETPGTATRRDGKVVLAAGHYRYKALDQLGAPFMGLMIIPELSDRDLYEISYRENAEREDQSAFDNALAWRTLLADKIYQTEEELANAVGLSPANVNKTIGILRLTDTVLDLVAADPTRYPLSVLYELALFEAVGGTERTMAFAKAVAASEIGRQQIQDARAQLQDKKPRKGRETSRQYKIVVGDVSSGTLKEWPSGKVAFEVQINDPTLRAAFVAELREKFEAQ